MLMTSLLLPGLVMMRGKEMDYTPSYRHETKRPRIHDVL